AGWGGHDDRRIDRRASPNNAKRRFASVGKTSAVLEDILDDEVNLAIWERRLDARLTAELGDFLALTPDFKIALAVARKSAWAEISAALGGAAPTAFADDVAELVGLFCSLFGQPHAGLRLKTLHSPMCPRFHVDRLPCRLVTSYLGVATEWLPHAAVDRSKLGQGSQGKPDHESGLYANDSDIRRMGCGDVALLKGEQWRGNGSAGLVHRSPAVPDNAIRLLLTLDFID
ncbi:MAG: DUF1826 domain-containing protein, partial [Pseudomonadota bacterium]